MRPELSSLGEAAPMRELGRAASVRIVVLKKVHD
jgi:hypothetical protein